MYDCPSRSGNACNRERPERMPQAVEHEQLARPTVSVRGLEQMIRGLLSDVHRDINEIRERSATATLYPLPRQ